jgi:flagellar biosynthetic protein FliP
MQPVFEKSYNDGIKPLMDNKISEEESLKLTAEPFREFMLKHVREDDLSMFLDLAEQASGGEEGKNTQKADVLCHIGH